MGHLLVLETLLELKRPKNGPFNLTECAHVCHYCMDLTISLRK